MRILVTGAAGFMGSHLVDSLIAMGGHDVYGVDDLSGGYTRNVHPKSHFTVLDLRDKGKTETYITHVKPQLLYHLAADATEGRSQFTPISATERNYLAYLYTLIPCIRCGVKKVVLTSSMSVYGAQTPPFTEIMRRIPEDIYAIAKTAMEEATEILSKVHGFTYVIVRPHNVYGPKQNLADPYRNVIGIFINCILNDKNFYIYGNGEQKRAFTYIDDFNPYFVNSGFLDSVNGEIINIGPQEEYTINELSDVVLDTFFPHGKIPAHLKPKYLPMRPQEVKEAYCTHDKAVKLLGYKTRVTLKEGVDKMVDWAKTMGPQKFTYLKHGLELETKDTPLSWSKKLY
ncbi:NAD-dependent epimerase/dehydratase family protein [Candidatus Gottesmanbacteria bacterium]|nr:NAD-dependent epimerase/dehydratase family protein [Candidatus Gottesmanbacteria bacterium]